jgi:hypothetical protein
MSATPPFMVRVKRQPWTKTMATAFGSRRRVSGLSVRPAPAASSSGDQDFAVGPDPLIDLDRRGRIELVRQHDVAREDVRPALPADAQGVAEAAS